MDIGTLASNTKLLHLPYLLGDGVEYGEFFFPEWGQPGHEWQAMHHIICSSPY